MRPPRTTNDREWLGLAAGPGQALAPVIVSCDHDEDGRSLCRSCVELLSGVLADVPALLVDLATAEAKQVRFVEQGSRADAEEAVVLPWNERASLARRDLVRALGAVLSDLGLIRQGSGAQRARRLSGALERFGQHPGGPGWALLLSQAAAAAHVAIDRPSQPWYYGPCPVCSRDVYGERLEDPDALVVCPAPDCGYSAPLSAHRLHQLDAGDDRLLTVGELVGAITSAGEQVTRDQINSWIRREGLARESRVRPRLVGGELVAGSPVYVYRLGDVRRLAHEAAARRASGAAA